MPFFALGDECGTYYIFILIHVSTDFIVIVITCLFTKLPVGPDRDGIRPSWFSPNPIRTRRSKPELDPKPRPHKEARFGPTVVFPVH